MPTTALVLTGKNKNRIRRHTERTRKKESNDQIKDNQDAPTLDAALIAAIQRVEHYEIAGYGCAATYAELLGDHESAKLLKQTLDEEKEEDKKLTNLATSTINLFCHLDS